MPEWVGPGQSYPHSETSLSLILNTILSEREELLQMEQISLTLDYDVEDEFHSDDVDEPFEIEANNVSVEDEIPAVSYTHLTLPTKA